MKPVHLNDDLSMHDLRTIKYKAESRKRLINHKDIVDLREQNNRDRVPVLEPGYVTKNFEKICELRDEQ